MTRRLRRVTVLIFFMFLALFASTSILQVITAPSLQADARNTRTTIASYSVQRGEIIAGTQVLAKSVPVNTVFKFQRQYENAGLYSSIVGYYTRTQGSAGIEQALNTQLTGKSDDQFLTRVQNLITGRTPQGAAVTLTIDPRIQQAASDALGDHIGAAVAIEPKTGRILAMVSKPGFDTNTLTGSDDQQVISTYKSLLADPNQPLVNRAIGGATYPPGSTFKLVVSAAALENGFTPDSEFDNVRDLTLTGTSTQVHNISNTLCGSGSKTTMRTALQYSCNIPFAELGGQLGEAKISAVAAKFGFGHTFKIPLKVTASQYPSGMTPAQLQLASFGQYDVRATPLQMALVSAGIANGGAVMTPQLVQSVQDDRLHTTQSFQAKKYSQAVDPATAETLSQMMQFNVSSGAISSARINGVDVAGKTGTAETTKSAQYTLWFTGFAPANDPKVAVAVAVENGGAYNDSLGSHEIAAPIGRDIMKAVLDQ